MNGPYGIPLEELAMFQKEANSEVWLKKPTHAGLWMKKACDSPVPVTVEVVLGPLQTLMWGYIGRKYVYNIDFEDSRTLWAEVIE